MCGFQSIGQRHHRGFAIAEHNLAASLAKAMIASRVYDQADIFSRIVRGTRPAVGRALHPA
jgi:hypothetical protein